MEGVLPVMNRIPSILRNTPSPTIPSMVGLLLLTLMVWAPSVRAYSPIWSIDGWDTARLKQVGIAVKSWEHHQIGEEPPLKWVEFTYDWSKLGEDQEVILTLRWIGDDGQALAATRLVHEKGDSDIMKLVFAAPADQRKFSPSYVEILVPNLLAKAAERPFGDPGFGGYVMRFDRIMELAGGPMASEATGDGSSVLPTAEEPCSACRDAE